MHVQAFESPPVEARISPEAIAQLLRKRYEAAGCVRRGICLLNAGKFVDAAEAFDRARQLGSTDRSLPAYIAGGLLGQGDSDAAADQFAQIGRHFPADITNQIRHALCLRSAGRTEEAIEVLRCAVRERPECAELHYQLGTLLAGDERFEEAELRFTQAVSIDREHASALVSLALCCGVRQGPAEALTHLQRAQNLRPHDAHVGWLLAQAAAAVQQQGLCVRMKAAISSDENAADPRGIAELSRIIEAEPDFVDAFLSIPAGQVDDAVFAMLLSTLRVALERQPEHAELHYHCGRVLDRLGRRGDAIDENERAVELDPTFIRALIELGKLYHATDRAADATTRLEQAIRSGAEYADVYFLLGNLYRDQGRVGQAKTAYVHALAINASFEAAQKALAELVV
jgi:tetratricopeptide (TPR) repeat protein